MRSQNVVPSDLSRRPWPSPWTPLLATARSLFPTCIWAPAICRPPSILDFLRHNEADTIYLVGDIIDGWRLRASWYWPQAHNDVIQKLLRKVRHGARMVFVPGNHDEFARQFIGQSFGGIEIVRNAVHVAADGKRYFVLHGDEFDVVVRHSKWLDHLGDWAYDFALFINTHFNVVRRFLGFGYWSFSAWAKLKVKKAVNFIGSFERELAAEAKRRGTEGVICGHIHHPALREIEEGTYVNAGDFVESYISSSNTTTGASKSCSGERLLRSWWR